MNFSLARLFVFKRLKSSLSKSLLAMSDMEGCKDLFADVVKEFQQDKGRRPSAKELARLTGLEQDDAAAILSEIPKEPAKKKPKTAPKPGAMPTEPEAPVPEAVAAPSAPGTVPPEFADTQIDEPSQPSDPLKEEAKSVAPKPGDAKGEDAKSEAPTQVCLSKAALESPAAVSPPEMKQVENKEASNSLGRGDSQR